MAKSEGLAVLSTGVLRSVWCRCITLHHICKVHLQTAEAQVQVARPICPWTERSFALLGQAIHGQSHQQRVRTAKGRT